jgi:hypothetical protein
MQAKGFFASLFDFSFSVFITSRIIKVLYVLSTILLALWTLALILLAFRSSTGFGIVMLVVGGPLFFVITQIYVRVVLELIMVIFRIHEDVDEINRRGGGGAHRPVASEPFTGLAPVSVAPTATEPEPAPAPEPEARFCEACGAERTPGKSFCTACGKAFA